jgi:hypothetical protein
MRADNSGRSSRTGVRRKRSGVPKKAGRSKDSKIDEILKRVEERVMENIKPSVADLVRLLEIRRELKKSVPRKLTVKWIDECAEPGSEE